MCAAAQAVPGDMILTLGAGSVSQIAPLVVARLQPVEAEVGSSPST